MATTYDAVAEIVSLLDTNWTTGNTDDKKPNIAKITDYPKELYFHDSKGYILLYSINETKEKVGIGLTTKANITELISIDIRIYNDESYFKKVKTEVENILFSNSATGTTNYDIVDAWSTNRNLSNKMKGFFREVKDINVIVNNRDMTA